MKEESWIFGYGSLVWRPGFAFVDSKVGYIKGWVRKFYQGSADHRGTPQAPGRVATLLSDPQAICWGIAYKVAKESFDSVFSYLDDREKGGFTRHIVPFFPTSNEENFYNTYVYVATTDNPNYLGPASIEEIAQQIINCEGPSGPNIDYLLNLAKSLRSMEVVDQHVFEIEQSIKEKMDEPRFAKPNKARKT